MMDNPGLDAAKWSNPEFVRDDASDHVDVAEAELFDMSTIDPSHIIHLIRQLLPNGEGANQRQLESLSNGPGLVQATTSSGILSERNGIVQQTSTSSNNGSLGGPVSENVIKPAGQELDTNSAKQETSDTVTTDVGCGSATADISVADPLSEEQIQENRNSAEEHANHTEHRVSHVDVNQGLDRAEVQEGGTLIKQSGDIQGNTDHLRLEDSARISDIAEDPTKSMRAEDCEESNVLDAAEADCVKTEEELDQEEKTGGQEDAREEAGCVLWDLAANEAHAEFMVKHHMLNVLLALLVDQHSDRMREICLGILGNLACHSVAAKAMVATDGLVEVVVQQLFVESIPSLTETCRLLSASFHGEVTANWVEAVRPDVVLERIMWIAGNTLDSQLLEKCTELILVMVDSRRDAASALLPSLFRLNLPGLLTDLIECELTAISEGSSTRGDVVLDIVLQIAEAISIFDDSASQLATNEFYYLVCQVIRLSARDEIGPSGITATVLIANLLTEESKLIENVLHDAIFLGRLLALAPCAGEDPGARNALWSIIGRICRWLVSTTLEDPQYRSSGMLAALADGCSSLLDDLEMHREDDIEEEDDRALAGHDAAASTSRGLQAKLATIVNMMRVMELWNDAHGGSSPQDVPLFRSVRNARTLLQDHLSASEISWTTVGKKPSSPLSNGSYCPSVSATASK